MIFILHEDIKKKRRDAVTGFRFGRLDPPDIIIILDHGAMDVKRTNVKIKVRFI